MEKEVRQEKLNINSKITSENCDELVRHFIAKHDDDTCTSAAWRMVYNMCLQNGMKGNRKTGIGQTIHFLEGRFRKIKELRAELKSKTKPSKAKQ